MYERLIRFVTSNELHFVQIYSSCNEAYRLTQSGYINVPPEATDQFCYGPCLSETHLVLDCVDHSLSTFVFYNKATINTIRTTLRAACSHSNQRGTYFTYHPGLPPTWVFGLFFWVTFFFQESGLSNNKSMGKIYLIVIRRIEYEN